jgi:hypothetical protein
MWRTGAFFERQITPAKGWHRFLERRAGRLTLIDSSRLMLSSVKVVLALFCLALAGCAAESPKPYQVKSPGSLPVALDKNYEFRKTKEYFLDPAGAKVASRTDPSVAFERNYRLYGAVTALDTRQLYGTYLDFFWRAPRDSDVKIRFEYKQENLHAFVQAREVHYPHARSHNRTEFAIIGDDYADDGRVIAWQALLIADGRIVAVTRSYLWK